MRLWQLYVLAFVVSADHGEFGPWSCENLARSSCPLTTLIRICHCLSRQGSQLVPSGAVEHVLATLYEVIHGNSLPLAIQERVNTLKPFLNLIFCNNSMICTGTQLYVTWSSLSFKLLQAFCGSRWLDWYTLHYLPSNSCCAWWWMVLAPWVLTVPGLEWIERNPGSRYKWKTFGYFRSLFHSVTLEKARKIQHK